MGIQDEIVENDEIEILQLINNYNKLGYYSEGIEKLFEWGVDDELILDILKNSQGKKIIAVVNYSPGVFDDIDFKYEGPVNNNFSFDKLLNTL